MIKNFLLLLFFSFLTITVKSQTDTSAYETQRLKINNLLNERSEKFGQYEESLNARTGIFGFQTKTDLKNSNEILRGITINDNNIFRELKVLLDYKDLEFQQVKNNINTTSGRIQSYMVAIKKLQDQNQLLRAQAEKLEAAEDFAWYLITFLLLTIIGIVVLFYLKFKK